MSGSSFATRPRCNGIWEKRINRLGDCCPPVDWQILIKVYNFLFLYTVQYTSCSLLVQSTLFVLHCILLTSLLQCSSSLPGEKRENKTVCLLVQESITLCAVQSSRPVVVFLEVGLFFTIYSPVSLTYVCKPPSSYISRLQMVNTRTCSRLQCSTMYSVRYNTRTRTFASRVINWLFLLCDSCI